MACALLIPFRRTSIAMHKSKLSHHDAKLSHGFSLIELLTAIAIIAIMAGIIIPVTNAIKVSAAKSNDTTNIRQIALAVLTYNAENNSLPGRVNRAVRIPSTISDTSSTRKKWFSTYMVDAGYLPEDDKLWSPPMDYGIAESGHNYILNNTIYSSPGNFFGRRSSNPDKVSPPLNIMQLRSNISAESPDDEPLPDIWMICNLDGDNYDSLSTVGSAYAVSGDLQTPWGGRHYAYFDGRVAFVKPADYPSRD